MFGGVRAVGVSRLMTATSCDGDAVTKRVVLIDAARIDATAVRMAGLTVTQTWAVTVGAARLDVSVSRPGDTVTLPAVETVGA